MRRDTILIIGARGPIGVGLTRPLRDLQGAARVVAADPEPAADGLFGDGMLGLLNVLELAREKGIGRVFWPSSIAVFGPDAPGWNCPQNAAPNPATVYASEIFHW